MAGVYSGFTNVVIEAAFRSPCHSIDPSFANAHLHAIAKSMNYYVHTRTLEHTRTHAWAMGANAITNVFDITRTIRHDTMCVLWLGGCRRFGQNSSVYNACVSIASVSSLRLGIKQPQQKDIPPAAQTTQCTAPHVYESTITRVRVAFPSINILLSK